MWGGEAFYGLAKLAFMIFFQVFIRLLCCRGEVLQTIGTMEALLVPLKGWTKNTFSNLPIYFMSLFVILREVTLKLEKMKGVFFGEKSS